MDLHWLALPQRPHQPLPMAQLVRQKNNVTQQQHLIVLLPDRKLLSTWYVFAKPANTSLPYQKDQMYDYFEFFLQINFELEEEQYNSSTIR